MAEHRCKWVIDWGIAHAGDGRAADRNPPNFSPLWQAAPIEYCDKLARFKSDLGAWYCAEHWDALQELREQGAFLTQGGEVCAICNCEFYNGECNCGFYEHGA